MKIHIYKTIGILLILLIGSSESMTTNDLNNGLYSGGDAAASCAFKTYYTPTNVQPLSIEPEWDLQEDANGYTVSNDESQYQLDLNGNVTADASSTPAVSAYEVAVKVEGGTKVTMVFMKSPDVPAGTAVTIDIDYANAASVITNKLAVKTQNGYAFGMGIVDPSKSPNIINRVVQTDNKGKVVAMSELSDPNFYGGFSRLVEGSDGSIFTEWRSPGNYSLFTVPADGSAAYQTRVATDTPSSDWVETETSADGQFVYTMKTDNDHVAIRKYHVSDGATAVIDLSILKTASTPNGFRQTYADGIEPTTDGGLLVSLLASESISGGGKFYVLAKYGADGMIVWKKEFSTPNFRLTPVGETADGGALFAGSTSGQTVFIKTTVDGQLEPICEDKGNGDQADLSISDLIIENSPIGAGKVLSYNFDATNIGSADVPDNFTIKGYISKDATLSSDDVQDGAISTGNYNKGFTASDVDGASTILGSLADGDYYLILKIDADGKVAESNESNNVIASPFTISSSSGDPCANIDVTIGKGEVTIGKVNSARYIAKVFKPDWSKAMDCTSESCSLPKTLTGLAGGKYFIEILLLNENWGEICRYEKSVDISE